jgi:tetratricopeptide (TPR) repeat protein
VTFVSLPDAAMSRTATMPKRRLPLAIALLAIAAAALAWRVVPYTTAYRHFLYSRMSREQLWSARAEHLNDPLYLYYLGRSLNRDRQFAAADPYLKRAAGLDPDSASIRDEWIKALMGSGRVSIAFGILRQFMATHPNAPEPPLLLGKFYVSREEWPPALRALETAVKLAPQNAEAWSLLAHTRIKMGRYADAQAALAKAIELDPKDANNHLQLAVLLSNGDNERARQEFLRAVELAPGDPVCRRQYGRFLLDTGDTAGAEREARFALAQNGQDVLAQLLLGRVLAAQGRWQEATAPLTEMAHLAPDDPQAAELLRRAYRQLHRPDLAAPWEARYLALTQGQEERRKLEDAVQAHPQDLALHHRFALALARIADVNGCLREEAFAARTTPDNARALTAAARDLDGAGYAMQSYPLARRAAQQALNPEAHEALGMALVHMGRLHEAAIQFEQIKDWHPEHAARYQREILEAARRIAQSQAPAEQLLRAAQSEPDRRKAETMLQQAMQIEPDNTRVLRALVHTQFALGEMQQTAATALNLASLSPEDGVGHTYYVAARLALLGSASLTASEERDLIAHLQAATRDTTVASIFYYDQGLIALKRGQVKEALVDLETTRRMDPTARPVYRALAEARSLSGDRAGAAQALAELDRLSRHTP